MQVFMEHYKSFLCNMYVCHLLCTYIYICVHGIQLYREIMYVSSYICITNMISWIKARELMPAIIYFSHAGYITCITTYFPL